MAGVVERLAGEFRRLGQASRLEAGHMLWQEGDPAGLAVLLTDGVLEVVQESLDGQVVVLRHLEAGALLGEMSCFDSSPHSATVRARTPCSLVRMAAGPFRELARRHPEFLEWLLERQSERVRSLSRQVATLAFESVTRRLARFLLEASVDGPTPPDGSARAAVVRLTHQEMAERVAATRESVSKALGAMARAGWVRLSRGQVEIADQAALLERAEEGEV